MSDEAWKAVGQIAILIGMGITAYNAWRSKRQSQANTAKLQVMHDQINGQQALLLKATAAEATATGEQLGREKMITERHDRLIEDERVADRTTGIGQAAIVTPNPRQLDRIEDNTEVIKKEVKAK